eukprot:scaffold3747_cov240-Pinguiococcus_pyrenoidosus.AAC.3
MSEHVACRGSRRVAQSYFDELVEENMQLFEASRQDAIKDTIAELQVGSNALRFQKHEVACSPWMCS